MRLCVTVQIMYIDLTENGTVSTEAAYQRRRECLQESPAHEIAFASFRKLLRSAVFQGQKSTISMLEPVDLCMDLLVGYGRHTCIIDDSSLIVGLQHRDQDSVGAERLIT